MVQVQKFSVELKDSQKFSMPTKTKLLGIVTVSKRPWLLALVDPEKETLNRVIRVYEDGEIKGGKYIGTHQEGPYMYHIFDDGEE